MSDEQTIDQIDPLIGLLVDERYRVTRRLARGGMATVYVAQDERLDRPVAFKVMHPHLADSQDFVARFRREARSVARIIHPGVVSVFDQGVVNGQGFLVMELVDGTNLRQLLEAQGAFTIPQALRYASETLEALRAAHRLGLIHRDIKPENILVPSEGNAKVTDFGLARAASDVSMSTTGSLLGTVAYIAPEIALTATPDARSDLYSVGIMVYEMLTGFVPWAGESALQVVSHHASDDVPKPSAREPWIPREVDDLVASLTARDPASRPANASEAIDLITRTAATIPSDIAERRATIAPEERGPAAQTESFRTEVISTQLTRPLPPPPAPSHATVQTTQRVPQAPEAARTTTAKRMGAWVSLVVLVLLAAGFGGRWWWTEYGPGSYLTMPETAGRPLDEVRADLDALGLSLTIEEEFSDDVSAGTITRSDPVGTQRVHKYATVQLYVSKGVDVKTVPDVTGKSQDDAHKTLSEAGLSIGAITDAYSEDVPEGKVVSQATPAGSSLPHDTAVDVVISKGREPIRVPSLTGLSADAAKKAIEDLGLVASPTEAHSDTVAEGQVISQQTSEGTILHRTDSVAYTLSKGPEKIAVPDVVGRQRRDARNILESAGFTVQEEAVLGGFFGTVRATDPVAGTMAKKGAVITITVV